jgi:SsrA-binding protein
LSSERARAGGAKGAKGAKASKTARRASGRQAVASNRRARYDYEILETFEAGIVLAGPEVKSLRAGRANLRESFAVARRGEIFLQKLHISPYEPATRANPADPLRDRKLLLKRAEIAKLAGRVEERGLTLVPLSIYFKDGRAKVELALARGRHTYDKRAALREREDEETARRALRARGGAHRR